MSQWRTGNKIIPIFGGDFSLIADKRKMGIPRQVLPGRFYTLTRRCVNRMFLLRPDEQTNNNYLYCLILAAIRFNVVIIATCAVSNHHHTNLLDRDGRLPEFVHYFHALLARCQNCYRGRWENFWASGGPSAVELVEPGDIERAVVYTLTNPVKDFLVEEVTHWPGVNSWSALRADRALTATRPRHFFRKRMPGRVELKMAVPAEAGVGSHATFVERVGAQIATVEDACRQERNTTGRRILGRRAVLQQSPFDSPTSSSPRGKLSPRVKCADKWRRIETLTRNRAFVAAHREARLAWIADKPHAFPPGTWALRHLVKPDARALAVDRATKFADHDL